MRWRSGSLSSQTISPTGCTRRISDRAERRRVWAAVSAAGVLLPSNLLDTTDLETWTQEVRLASDNDSPFQWVVGAFYSKIDRVYTQTLPTPGYDAVTDATLGAGTSAAVEYAVTSLGVAHIVVLGHSNCGGVKGCHDMCMGHAPDLEKKSSFVGRWMDILRPGFERVREVAEADRLRALEKEAVLVSLENLMTFPFVREAVEDDRLTLHGLWTDTGEGGLEQFDPAKGGFSAV